MAFNQVKDSVIPRTKSIKRTLETSEFFDIASEQQRISGKFFDIRKDFLPLSIGNGIQVIDS
jgi:hypothetical protein